jgi:hypothetical protein
VFGPRLILVAPQSKVPSRDPRRKKAAEAGALDSPTPPSPAASSDSTPGKFSAPRRWPPPLPPPSHTGQDLCIIPVADPPGAGLHPCLLLPRPHLAETCATSYSGGRSTRRRPPPSPPPSQTASGRDLCDFLFWRQIRPTPASTPTSSFSDWIWPDPPL